MLASFFLNQLAATLDLSFGVIAAIGAAIIGYVLLITSAPMKRLWRWGAARRSRAVVAVILWGVGTGMVGGALAWVSIWQQRKLARYEAVTPQPSSARHGEVAPSSQPTTLAEIEQFQDVKPQPKRIRKTSNKKPAPSQSNEGESRHLTVVQSRRLAKLFAELPREVAIRIETVANQAEAAQYAKEFNDVRNAALGADEKIVLGLSFNPVPQSVRICVSSEDDAGVNAVAQRIGEEMALSGIAALMNVHPSFPAKTVTILVGVKPID